MKLLALSASVFYLLGLKLTTQIHLKSNIVSKPTVIESQAVPKTKATEGKATAKPFDTPKDSTLSAEKKIAAPDKSVPKSTKVPSAGKGAA